MRGAAGDGEIGAGLRQRTGEVLAEAAAGAGDERHSAGEIKRIQFMTLIVRV